MIYYARAKGVAQEPPAAAPGKTLPLKTMQDILNSFLHSRHTQDVPNGLLSQYSKYELNYPPKEPYPKTYSLGILCALVKLYKPLPVRDHLILPVFLLLIIFHLGLPSVLFPQKGWLLFCCQGAMVVSTSCEFIIPYLFRLSTYFLLLTMN